MLIKIPFQGKDFPKNFNAPRDITTSWSEIIHAAITVGRPSINAVVQHGTSSYFEAIFRASMVKMALKPHPDVYSRNMHNLHRSRRYNLKRTNAFISLDPSEKGAVNYFLGMVFAKLAAMKLLDAPWMMHLDVYHDANKVSVNNLGRSRPDLIGQTQQGDWVVIESKGRSKKPLQSDIHKSKEQSRRVQSIGGCSPTYLIGSFSFFIDDFLSILWIDPPESPEADIVLSELPLNSIQHHYALAIELLLKNFEHQPTKYDGQMVKIKELDLQMKIAPNIVNAYLEKNWSALYEISRVIEHDRSDPSVDAYSSSDGISIHVGESWFDSAQTR